MSDEERPNPLLVDHPIAIRVSLLFWFIGGFLFLAMAVEPLMAIVQDVDDGVWQFVVDWEVAWLVTVAKVFNIVGSTWVLGPIMVLMAGYLIWKRRWTDVPFWVGAMVVSQALIGPMKGLYERPRPPLPLVETTAYSFPSGHALAGTAVAVALVIVLFPAGPRRRNLEMAAVMFALLMGWSRVYLRAHWLSDAIAGVALGAAVAIGIAALVHYWILASRIEP